MLKKDHPLSKLTLNWQQKRIVKCSKKINHCIVGGTGTGKTKILIARMKYVLWKYHCKPSEILTITFSCRAAKEIIDCLNNSETESQFYWVDTFRGICQKILIEEKKLNDSDFVKNKDRNLFIKKICEKSKQDWFCLNTKSFDELNRLVKLEEQPFETAFEHVYNFSDDTDNPADNKTQIIQHAKNLYQEYTEWLKHEQKYDHEDAVHMVRELLTKNPTILENCQNKFKFIFVDEFQDVDRFEYEIIQLIAGNKSKTFVVGDPDQSICSWQNVIPNFDQKFCKDFAHTKRCVLKRGYRCSKNILKIAKRLIKNNKDRVQQKLFTTNPKGRRVVYYHASSPFEEAKWIASKINEQVNKSKRERFSDIGIICHSLRWQKIVEEELALHNFPYKISQETKFYDLPEIKTMIGCLKAIIYKDSSDPDKAKFLYDIAAYWLKIKKQDLNRINNFALYNKSSLYQAFLAHDSISNLDCSTHQTIDQFLDNVARVEYLIEHGEKSIKFHKIIKIFQSVFKQTFSSLSSEQQENLNLLRKSAGEFEKNHTQSNFGDFVDRISSFYKLDIDQNFEPNQIQIMTVRNSKGTEFPCVFVTGLVNGVFPKSFHLTRNELEEERRKLYVALTRAREHLYLSSCKWINRYTNKPMSQCQFADEIKSRCKTEKNFKHVI